MSDTADDITEPVAHALTDAIERRRLLGWEIAKIRQNHADTQVSRALAARDGDMTIADMMRVEWNANAQWDKAYPTLAALAHKPIVPQ